MFTDKHSNQKSEIGKLGENLACEYLNSKKYSIIERNFKKPYGEIDIVAKDKNGILAFIEVKTMRQNNNLKPEDNLTSSKLEKMRRIASLYAGYNSNLVNDKSGWRIDLIAISLKSKTKNGFDFDLNHFENI